MALPHSGILPKTLLSRVKHEQTSIRVSERLIEASQMDREALLARFQSQWEGLDDSESAARLERSGPNVLAKDMRKGLPVLIWNAVLNPLVILLSVLASVSLATGDARAALVMLMMIILGVGLKLIQEAKADNAAAKLRAMISVHATVIRNGTSREIPISQLVAGDIVSLSAGDMVPADLKILTAKDLFIVQSALTGESYPVEKFEKEKDGAATAPAELKSVAFLGTSVESGSATALVVATGKETYLGSMAESLTEEIAPTAFDRGIADFTWLMLRFVLCMVPLVFLISGFAQRNWGEAFFFAIAVAVGLTPEMLPMIVTVCLSKGAVAMSRKKVIVKRINAIQNLGAMDVLCTDKTGTLTMDRVILEKHCDVELHDEPNILALAYLNSHFQTGLKNVLDRAILAHTESHAHENLPDYAKVDEIPFDFHRRIMSVVVRTPEARDRIISKGAPEAIFPCCSQFRRQGQTFPMDEAHYGDLTKAYESLSADGFRVLAIASKDVEPRSDHPSQPTPYGKQDEVGLTLEGYIAFLDPPKETATAAILEMQRHGVTVKVVTGDNELVSRKICKEVGLPLDQVLLGTEVEGMSDSQLQLAASNTTLFARVSPSHKQRIIRALQAQGHIVGFMGDGINDAPALRAADVGISVDTAVDIAKESADMILLEKSLLVLVEGVVEGRKVFANILKYVRMGASSNFGNMFSVLGASFFVPFLPMAPIQILANNMLYDISQTAIPTDEVDAEQLIKPRPWDMKQLTRFILFIGPCSSVFDYTTFWILLNVFGCWEIGSPESLSHSQSLFQTGWFVESLLTQTLIIHIIRTNKIPFLQSRASWPLLVTSAGIMMIGVALPYSLLGKSLGFSPLPSLYWWLLGVSMALYVALTQVVKTKLVQWNWI